MNAQPTLWLSFRIAELQTTRRAVWQELLTMKPNDPERATSSLIVTHLDMHIDDLSKLVDLPAALIEARNEIKFWHDLNSSEQMKREDWIAYQQTARMQLINHAILTAKQG